MHYSDNLQVPIAHLVQDDIRPDDPGEKTIVGQIRSDVTSVGESPEKAERANEVRLVMLGRAGVFHA